MQAKYIRFVRSLCRQDADGESGWRKSRTHYASSFLSLGHGHTDQNSSPEYLMAGTGTPVGADRY